MAAFTSLVRQFSQDGEVVWLGLRPSHGAEMSVERVIDAHSEGLSGEVATNRGERAVTLIQYEHLAVIRQLSGHGHAGFSDLRRNIAVRGINLLALRKTRFQIGKAILEGTGICAPCRKMETALGRGGFNAMRGHGGITARIINPGSIAIGDLVKTIDIQEEIGAET